ncbi:Acyl-CoA thioesterase 8 [Orbilia oligospora]|uniref:Acyl-CoA thioesterase 8 n=1 Tax=Orbilia oligospora TaxID=2813651 RepID=A0A7C8QRT1_ORBOL|nr:Acyl-CoA thioesterase 8 [Orbilia oligospora]
MGSSIHPGYLPSPVIQQIEVNTDKEDPNISVSNPDFHFLPSRSASIFGGQVVAQAILAAHATIDPALDIHSIHSDPKQALIYRVSNVRTGNTIANRLVNVFQHTRLVFMATMSFHRFEKEPVLKYNRGLPSNFPPFAIMNPIKRSDYYQMIFKDGLKENEEVLLAALEVKHLVPNPTALHTSTELAKLKDFFRETPNVPLAGTGLNKTYRFFEESLRSGSLAKVVAEVPSATSKIIYQYMKVNGELPENRAYHTAAFAFASDAFSSQLPAVLVSNKDLLWITSLDHTIYFHKPVNPCDWLAVENIVSVADAGRSLVEMRYWNKDGELVATVMQEVSAHIIYAHYTMNPAQRPNDRAFFAVRRRQNFKVGFDDAITPKLYSYRP